MQRFPYTILDILKPPISRGSFKNGYAKSLHIAISTDFSDCLALRYA